MNTYHLNYTRVKHVLPNVTIRTMCWSKAVVCIRWRIQDFQLEDAPVHRGSANPNPPKDIKLKKKLIGPLGGGGGELLTHQCTWGKGRCTQLLHFLLVCLSLRQLIEMIFPHKFSTLKCTLVSPLTNQSVDHPIGYLSEHTFFSVQIFIRVQFLKSRLVNDMDTEV